MLFNEGGDIVFDASTFLPSPSDWFSTSVEYEGWGRAEFSEPKGSVEGETCVSFDESGEATIEMRPDLNTIKADRELRFGLTELLSGAKPTPRPDGTFFLSYNFSTSNPCTRLEVTTPHGTFISHNVPYHGRNQTRGEGQGQVIDKITFEVFISQFDSELHRKPKYWVLSLTNFVSEFSPGPTELDRHPLRIYPTPEVPDEITDVMYGPNYERDKRRAMSALLAANSENRLIAFEFNDARGFIERLPDYGERKDTLLTETERSRPTAVMVGEVDNEHSNTDLEDLERWLSPHSLLMVVTLATGTEVGVSWIELRDEQGRLVRRFHRRLRETRFSRGHRVIDELPFKDQKRPTGTGYLITKACGSDELGQSALRTAILHLTRSKYRGQTLDESLAHLCRGLDGLCEHYDIARQNLTESLDEYHAREIKEVLAEAAKKIRDLQKAAGSRDESGTAAILQTIEGRVQNAANTERKFGLALADLLDQFGMPDAKVLDAYYKTRPRADKREHWVDVVSHYRTDVIHYGYLDLDAGGHDWRDVWAIINHLHDIMARVVLRAVGYDGGYHPTVVPGPVVPFALDWVKLDTMAGTLGYAWDQPRETEQVDTN